MFVTILNGPARSSRFPVNLSAKEAVLLASSGAVINGVPYRKVAGTLGDQILAQHSVGILDELKELLKK